MLATLLAGAADSSLLSNTAVDQVLNALHGLLSTPGPAAAAGRSPGASSDAGRGGAGALRTLKLSLLAPAVLLHTDAGASTARPAAVRCLAACFALAIPEVRWLPCETAQPPETAC